MFRNVVDYLLAKYSNDPENDQNNLEMADYYYLHKQYAGAFSFYLRAADRSENVDTQYYALIKGARCLEVPGHRKHTVRTVYGHAITICPNRPEAYYFLSRNYEWSQDWVASYTYANLGLMLSTGDKDPKLLNIEEYPGKHGLIFQKAIAAWWWGKCTESRDLHKELIENYFSILDGQYLAAIVNNFGIVYKKQYPIITKVPTIITEAKDG